MNDDTFNGLKIDVSTDGSEKAIKQFDKLAISISNVAKSISKLSNVFNKTMSMFGSIASVSAKVSNVTNKLTENVDKTTKRTGIIKNRNNRLNIGDMSNIETEKMDKPFTQYGLYQEFAKLDDSYKLLAKDEKTATVNLEQYSKQLKDTNKMQENANASLWKFIKRIKSLAYVLYTAKKLASVVSDIVKESGSWIENLNLFAVTFGESNYRDVLNWSTDYADKLGLANNEIVKMTGYFKQLSTAIGVTGEQGTQLSTILTQLTYDFSSFFNTDVQSVYEKLQSGIFSGQVRTLRTLGIDVSQTSIQNLIDTSDALKNIGLSATQLTQTQKVLARTILTMQAGSNAFGDLARSIDTLQNRQRIFAASIQNLKLALGDALSETARVFFAYAIAITQSITSIVRAIIPLKTELSYDIGDNIFTEIADDAEEASNAVGLLSFDKFTSLTSSENENVSATEALNSLLQEQIDIYTEISSQFDGIDEEVEKIKNNIMGWILPNTTLDELTKILDGLTSSEKFREVLNNLNPALQGIFSTASNLVSLIKDITPSLSKAGKIMLEIVGNIVTLFDKLNLLYPLILSYIGLNIYGKLSKLTGLSFAKLNQGITSILSKTIDLGSLSFDNATTSMELYFTKLERKVINGRETIVGSLDKAKIAATGLRTIMAGIMAFTLADSFFGQFEGEQRKIVAALTTVAAALMGVAAAAMATVGALSWGVAIPAIGAAIGVGIAGIKAAVESSKSSVKGYENGGIPNKSELFYMNERGIPEALVNTGSNQTNVINIQQLSAGMKNGFIEAMQELGITNGITINIDANNINDSAFARAIFPALKTESTRRGGNQL